MSSFTNIKNLSNIGLQKICIDSSGKDKENVYVCDAEGTLLKFNKNSLLSDGKPEIIEVPDSTTASIAWNGDNICVGYSKIDFIAGSEKQVVGRVNQENFDADNIADQLEFQLAVTTVDANSENVVGGSSDYAVKLTSLKSPDAELKTRTLEGEPLCVKLDPRNEYVAVSTVDGNVTILSIESFSIVHTLKDVFPKFESIDLSKPLIQLSWSKDGKWLFVPSKNSVKSFRRGAWEDAGVYRLKDHASAEFSVTAVSSCGKFLAASTMDNQVAVWNNESMELVSSSELKRNAPGTTVITSIEFSPFSPKQLIIADSNKGICLLNAFGTVSAEKSEDLTTETTNNVANESDDDDDSLLLNRTAKKNDLFNDIAMEDDEDTRMSSDLGAIKKQFGYGNEGLGGLEEFGFQLGEPDAVKPESSSAPPPPAYLEPSAPRKILVPEQFVCNSSDLEGSQRFLKYNRVGIVRSYVNEAEKVSTIDVEFHNKSIHGDIHIDNSEAEYELADISLKVVALASVGNKKKEGSSVLHVIPIQQFDNQRWTTPLPLGDGAIDVLTSNQQVVVLTRKRNIRIFTIGGVQRQIFTHSAPILTAACFEDRISIVSVMGSEFYENKKVPQWRFQAVEYCVSQKSWCREVKQPKSLDLPVESGEQVDWIAYSANGKLAVMDSAFNVHLLSAPGLWVPIFQSEGVIRSPSDGVFPIGLTASEFRYIYCRGSRYPLVNGINAPTTTTWKLPMCAPESSRTEMEQNLLLNELNLADAVVEADQEKSSEETKKLTKSIINLFAFLIKTNSDGQAAEVAGLVAASSSKAIQSLCNYASKCKKTALAEKVAEIGRQMAGEEEKKEAVLRPVRRIVKKKPVEEEEAEDRNEEEQPMSLDLDESLSTQPIRPIERLAKNPFAKSGDSSGSSAPSLSIFDQLEAPSTATAVSSVDQRKRARENEPTVSSHPARKQARLNFIEKKKPVEASGEKENETAAEVKSKSVSPYELWLSESKSGLKADFEGEEADFSKFCIQSFRALSKEQKEEWKAKAARQN